MSKHKYTADRPESVYDNSQNCMVMKARRQAVILEIVGNEEIPSQEQLRTASQRPRLRRYAGDAVARHPRPGPREALIRRRVPAAGRRAVGAGERRRRAAARPRRVRQRRRVRPAADRRPHRRRHGPAAWRSRSIARSWTKSSARWPATTRFSSSPGTPATPRRWRGNWKSGRNLLRRSSSHTPADSTRRSRFPGSKSTTKPTSSPSRSTWARDAS